MALEMIRRVKSHLAQITLKDINIETLRKHAVAENPHLKRSLARVNPIMLHQRVRLRETRSTNVASIRFFRCVHRHVSLEISFRDKFRWTLIALKAFIAGVSQEMLA